MGGARRDNELHFLPLPMGEGKWLRKALSVTFGDSSPKGGAKAERVGTKKWSVSVPIRSIHCFTTTNEIFRRLIISAFSPGMPPDR